MTIILNRIAELAIALRAKAGGYGELVSHLTVNITAHGTAHRSPQLSWSGSGVVGLVCLEPGLSPGLQFQ